MATKLFFELKVKHWSHCKLLRNYRLDNKERKIKLSLRMYHNLHKNTNPEVTGSNPLSHPKGDVDGGL